MRLGFQEPTGELETESRIIPIAKRIGMRPGLQQPLALITSRDKGLNFHHKSFIIQAFFYYFRKKNNHGSKNGNSKADKRQDI